MDWSDFVVLVLACFLWCWDYPADHPAKKFVRKFSFPFLYIGLWHSWAMFAPDPIRVNRRLRAVMQFTDGKQEVWSPLAPDGEHKLINALLARSFKYEHSVLGTNAVHLLAPLCAFLCRQAATEGRDIVSLELWRDFQMVNAFGAPEVYGPPQSFLFYTFDPRSRTGKTHAVKPPATPKPPVPTTT